MNSTRRVFLFVIYSIALLLLLSLGGTLAGFDWAPFKRTNLLSDILSTGKKNPSVPDDTTKSAPPPVIEEKPHEDFTVYQYPHFITNFQSDTNQASLVAFLEKLHELKSGKKKKVRIAYFGDSMIEGDLLTQTLRALLQQQFGGSGVGFVPITSQVSRFRQTVYANYSDGWDEENFKEQRNPLVFISGHVFRTDNAWVQLSDQTIHDSATLIEKSLLCGKTPGPVTVVVNYEPINIRASEPLNRILIGNNPSHSVRLSLSNENLPVYGISFESASGIFVDNFSFRGITGIELARIDSSLLASIAQNNPYDLIVFQYGVNLLFRPNDKNFNWYAKIFLPVIRKFRNCFAGTDFLLVSTADRAFRYDGVYKSAVGIDSLIRVQAAMAYGTGSSFYNQFASMGGHNSIVDWVKRNPSLANLDYVHPNHRGAELLGHYLYEAILTDYDKYIRSLK